MLKILSFTTLYPNREEPSHGIFVENRLCELAARSDVSVEIVAPVPYFPFEARVFGRYGSYARVPGQERRHGLVVHHPKFPLIPKVGMDVAALMLYLGTARLVKRLWRERGGFDLIDAHYAYPDGVAAAMLARDLEVPFTITVRGSDLTELPDYFWPRRQIRWAVERADALITVCAALKQPLSAMGIEEDKMNVFRNGVDLAQFMPRDRVQAQAELGVDGLVLLSVGHLIPRKGHDLVIGALPALPEATLLIAGDGEERSRLAELAQSLGVAERVRFLGRIAHSELATVYSAADILVLASSREGWANVLLEAMACGTPVVATDVWGTNEVVKEPVAGRLVKERTSAALAEAVRDLLRVYPDRSTTRQYAEKFSWEETTDNQIRLFSDLKHQ